MIGKIKKGKSFGGCIRYVMGKDNAEIIDMRRFAYKNRKSSTQTVYCWEISGK